MNEIEFKNWLIQKGFSPKVVGDAVYRLKRVERELIIAILTNNIAKINVNIYSVYFPIGAKTKK